MKKLLLVGASLGCFTFISAEGTEGSDNYIPSEGFYFGLGISFIDNGAKVDAETPDLYINDTHAPANGVDPYTTLQQAFPFENDQGKKVAKKVNATGNGVDGANIDIPKASGGKLVNQLNGTKTHLGGTALIGFQKILREIPLCFGLEIGADFSRQFQASANNQNPSYGGADYFDSQVTRSGCNPFAAIKIGYVSYSNQLMPYFKVGISRGSIKEEYQANIKEGNAANKEKYAKEHTSTFKFSSWQPTLALGVEKSINKDLTGRLEFEYRFQKKKNKDFSDNKYGKASSTANNALYILETGGHKTVTQKDSFTVRMLVSYNVKI